MMSSEIEKMTTTCHGFFLIDLLEMVVVVVVVVVVIGCLQH